MWQAPSWAAINLGVVGCLPCAGVHRQLGVHISKVLDVEGDALYTFRKGKRGCVFDLNFVACWAGGPEGAAASGKCTVTNFANDGGSSDGDEYELAFSPSCGGEVKEALRAKLAEGLAAWVTEFQQ